jgi:uncharacterized membrane protein YfcA
MTPDILALIGITLVGAIVNGALGYGFSSLTVPVALLFYTNRRLNPALVLVEVALNAHILWINRRGVSSVWRRVLPVVVGLLPGVVVGTSLVYLVNPGWMKFVTYVVLVPLILLQAGGIRRPIRSERSAGLALGGGVGVLYSLTTISGPPLALMFNNQGYTKQDFRAGLGLVRLAESSLTAVAYLYAGMFTFDSMRLLPFIIPSVVIGLPLGAVIIRRVRSETFRRVCMSFDAWIVAFGLSKVLNELRIIEGLAAYTVLAVVGAIDLYLLYRFFARPRQPVPGLSEMIPLASGPVPPNPQP